PLRFSRSGSAVLVAQAMLNLATHQSPQVDAFAKPREAPRRQGAGPAKQAEHLPKILDQRTREPSVLGSELPGSAVQAFHRVLARAIKSRSLPGRHPLDRGCATTVDARGQR